MPWRETWYDAPRDLTLPILPELPAGVEEFIFANPRQAFGAGKPWTFCPSCKGWVEGRPYTSRVDNLGPLCGRRGTEYHCPRCGEQIAFVGMVS
jgi:hypothetical protein